MKTNTFLYKTAVIVCHDFIYGPPHELRDFMVSHGVRELLFIGHVNRYVYKNSITRSYCEYWKNGTLVRKYSASDHHLPEVCSYVLDLYYSISWPLKIIKRPIDVFIGAGNINVFAGLLLNFITKAKKTVYYVIDYAPVRFSNKALNFLYHLLDAICARFSSSTWNYSSVMIKERSAKWHYAFPNQAVVPNGIRIRNDIIVPLERCNKHEIIYMGTLAGSQGVDTAIRALPGIQTIYSDATFIVIGDGKDLIGLKALVKKLKLSKAVTFLGFIEDPREMESRIAKASIGVACYDTNHPLVFTTEPGKVKRYLSCGIPVVMTDISPIAKDIENYSCGFIVSSDYKELMNTIINYFRNEKQMKTYRLHAFEYAKQFQWKVLFQKAFESLEK